MKPFARISAGLSALVACLSLGLAGASGQTDETGADQQPKAGTGKPAVPAGADEAGAVEESPKIPGLEMLPEGKTNLGVRLPVFEGAKQTMLFKAGEMTPLNKEELEMKTVEIRVLNDEGDEDTKIVMSSSRYLVNLGLLSSDERTVVHGLDYTITGDSMDFDTKKKFGVMRGHVRMVLRDFNKLTGDKEGGAVLKGGRKGEPAAPEKSTKSATETKNEESSETTPPE